MDAGQAEEPLAGSETFGPLPTQYHAPPASLSVADMTPQSRTVLVRSLLVVLALVAVADRHGAAADPVETSGYGRDLLGRPYWCSAGNCLAHGKRRIRGADRASFRTVSGRYALDRHRVWFEGLEVVGADPASWQVLGPNHGRDGRLVFVRRHAVPDLNADHTRYLPRHHLADARRAFYGEFDGEAPVLIELEGADPTRLRLLPGVFDSIATDGHHLFVGGQRMAIVLGTDFRPLWSGSGFALAFLSDAALYLLGPAPDPEPRSLSQHVPMQWIGKLRQFKVDWHGDQHWGLANGHLLVAAHVGDLLVLREGVGSLKRLPGTDFHAVVDDRLLFRHPNREARLVDLGPAAADLEVIDAWQVRNNGRLWSGGAAVPTDTTQATRSESEPPPPPARRRSR